MQSKPPMLRELLVCTTVALIAFAGLKLLLDGPGRGCTIIITGESVTISHCDFTGEFIDFAKTLKPHNHGSL
nr:triple gene block protein 3 [Elm carlavirus]